MALFGRLLRRFGYPFALLAIGVYAVVALPVVPYQPYCPGSGRVEGPISEEFVLAISDQLVLLGMTFAVYRTTYKDKTYGDREDVPEHWREHRTWNIHTTVWHARAGNRLLTAQRRALKQVLEHGRIVTGPPIDGRIANFGKWIDGRYRLFEDCALVRAVAIAGENGGEAQEFLSRSGWVRNVEETVKIEGRRLSNPQLRRSDSDAVVDWKVEDEKDGFVWPSPQAPRIPVRSAGDRRLHRRRDADHPVSAFMSRVRHGRWPTLG